MQFADNLSRSNDIPCCRFVELKTKIEAQKNTHILISDQISIRQ